jgi:hypothetical protein
MAIPTSDITDVLMRSDLQTDNEEIDALRHESLARGCIWSQNFPVPVKSCHLPDANEPSGPHAYLFNLILRHQLLRNGIDIVLGVPRYGGNPPSVPSVVKLIDVDAS